MEKQKLYAHVLKKWGIETQMDMVIEECAELIQAIQHIKRGRFDQHANLYEELADVDIMIEQMKLWFGANRINVLKADKLKRLEKRLRRN